REDRYRPLLIQPEVEERLPDPAHRAVALPVADPAPAVARALCEENPFRRMIRPMHQPFGHATRMGAELLGRAQHAAAVGPLFDVDFRRREPQRRVEHAFSQAAMLRRCESRILVNTSCASAGSPGRASSNFFTAQRSPRTRNSMRSRRSSSATALSKNSPVAWL